MPGLRPRLSTALRLVRFACVFVLLVVLVTAGAIVRVSLPPPAFTLTQELTTAYLFAAYQWRQRGAR